MKPLINQTVLMSRVKYFAVKELNPYSNVNNQPDLHRAAVEFQTIKKALEEAGTTVLTVDGPPGCQDGIFTANWALCRGDKAVLSSLPPGRKEEEPYAEKYLRKLGKQIIKPPYRFSGQGDALPCGNLLFTGSHYRNDGRMHRFLAKELGYEVIGLQTVPALDANGKPMINRLTGWPDSFFYDIDLAISILSPTLIAWCPAAFLPASQAKIRSLPFEMIEVSLDEALRHFACNLVSTGETVIMSATAPKLRAAIEARGLQVIAPDIKELAKGGGYIRCTTLTINNN